MHQINFFCANEPSEQQNVINATNIDIQDISSKVIKENISKVNTTFETFQFKKYIYEFSDEIRKLINTKGIHLIRAAAGGGKTYSIANICKQLAKVNKDTVYVIACPNRIQNIQNRGYTIHSLVGKEDVPDSARVISMVYDKADSIITQFIDKGKKVVLIIDEAHQLIDSKVFRKRAIQMLSSLADKCETVIHMTATSRKLTHIYSYSEVMTFESIEDISNINNFEIIQAEDLHATLISEIKKNKTKGIVPLVHLNDIDGLKSYEEFLTAKGYKIGLITSNHKNESLFLTIANKGIIPDGYDVILTTSVLEVGTNVFNTNIIPIKIVNNLNHFDCDSAIQFFARPRNFIEKAIMIIPSIKVEENFKFKDINHIKDKLSLKVNKAMNFTKKLYSQALEMNDYSTSEVNEIFKHMLKAKQTDDTSLGLGIIQIDEDNNLVSIDEKLLIKKVYNEYDKQLLIHTDKLIQELKGDIKCRNISVRSAFENNSTDSKNVKEIIRDTKEESSELARKIILSLSEKYSIEFNEYLNNPDLIDNLFTGELKDGLLFLEQEHKQLKKIMNAQKSGLSYEIIIELYKSDKSLKENARAFSYIERNNMFEINYMKKLIARDEYSVIRKHLDKVLIETNSRKITDKVIIEVANDMYKIGKMKSYYEKLLKADNEYKEAYNKYYNKSKSEVNKVLLEKSKEQRKKQLSKIKGKLLKEINLIYNTNYIENNYILNSLKTKFKPV